MRKRAIALTLTLALLFSAILGIFFVMEAKANPYPTPGIYLALENPQNTTYNNNTIPVVFTGTTAHTLSGISFYYSLDNKERVSIPKVSTIWEGMVPKNPPFYSTQMSGNLVLFNISEGWHHLSIYGITYDSRYRDEVCIDFFVDTVPAISILYFENKTFASTEVPLHFTVNQPASQIKYSLDGQDNMTIIGNITLSNLSISEHNITVYAWDANGNVGSSETIDFMIAEPMLPDPEPFPALPTISVVSASASAVTIVAGFLVLYRKRQRKHD